MPGNNPSSPPFAGSDGLPFIDKDTVLHIRNGKQIYLNTLDSLFFVADALGSLKLEKLIAGLVQYNVIAGGGTQDIMLEADSTGAAEKSSLIITESISTSGFSAKFGAGYGANTGLFIMSAAGAKKIIDANSKFQPVEILGTNLPANLGLFQVDDLPLIGTMAGFAVLAKNDANGVGLSFYRSGTGNVAAFTIFDNWELWYGQGETPTTANAAGIRIYSNIVMISVAGGGKYFYLDTSGDVIGNCTWDGLDCSEYSTGWKGNLLIVTMEAAGYTNAVAGDIGRVVTVGGNPQGVLYAYNNTTRIWKVSTINFVLPAGASAFAITGGTGVGTSVAAAPALAPFRMQNIKSVLMSGLALDGAGALTVYLTNDGTAGGTAIFTKRPVVKLSPDSAVLPTKSLSADFKTLTLAAGTVSGQIDIQVTGEVA